MDQVKNIKLGKGTLLVANPELDTDIFFRSVVLVCEHGPNGSFGIIINKILDFEFPEEIIDMKQNEEDRIAIRAGGPMQTHQMMIVHDSDAIPQESMQICPGVYLGGDLPFLEDALKQTAGPQLLLCFGFTGWAPGQLEREVLDELWFLHPGRKELVFHLPVETLWQKILREMGGKYASYSTIPEDLTLN